MKKVIGKNQVIITSLAILIAVAGYLNFADVDLGFRDKEASTDSSSILEDAGYDLTDETALLDENQADGGLTDNSLIDSQETDVYKRQEVVLPGLPHVGGLAYDQEHDMLWYSSNTNGIAQAISIKMDVLRDYNYADNHMPDVYKRQFER